MCIAKLYCRCINAVKGSTYRETLKESIITEMIRDGECATNYSYCFRLIDVGGQRLDRSKWLQCFEDDCNAILFFVDISAYDHVVEDPSYNVSISSFRSVI